MKAAILEEIGKPLTIADVNIPSLLPGQVRVKVFAAGICGAQLGEIGGAKGDDPYLPHLLGHEGAGVVEEIGPGVRTVNVGDHVVMHWRKGSGIEAAPAKYSWHKGFAGGGPVHTFCEYAVVSENRVTVISRDTPFDIAALMGCAVTTGFGLINNEVQLKIGQDILVVGCGGVGLCTIIAADLVGANRIVAVDRNKATLQLARECGATSATNVWDTFASYDAVVDFTGDKTMIDCAFEVIRSGGKLVLAGQPEYTDNLVLRGFRKNYRGLTIMDSQGGLTDPTKDIIRYLNMYQFGKLKLNKLITYYASLDQINEAIEMMRGSHPGRIIVRMNNGG